MLALLALAAGTPAWWGALPFRAEGHSQCESANAQYEWNDRAGQARNHGPLGEYYADAGLWAAQGTDYRSRMVVCSPGQWWVKFSVSDGGPAPVKAYPNVHLDFRNWKTGYEPRLDQFRELRVAHSARSPRRGTFNVAYDIWLNGIGVGAREVMIWTRNRGQTPAGRPIGHMIIVGQRWTVWKASVSGVDYLALVPKKPLDRAELPLLEILRRLTSRGLVPVDARLAQIGFGVEIVSTQGRTATFRVDRFRVTAGY